MSSDEVKRTRKTIKMKRPNPLFEKWLTEWMKDAERRNSQTKVMFSKALNSLKKYPLPLKSGKECLILENFGPHICEKLDQQLAEYKETQTISSTLCYTIQDNEEPKAKKPKETKERSVTKTLSEASSRRSYSKEYIPAWRSAAYALLVTLYNRLSEVGPPGEMTKAELETCAQALCETSLTKPDIGSYYTGWSSMGTLVKKNLVLRQGHPPKFSLTESGIALAEKLPTFDLSCTDTSPPKSVNVQNSELQNRLKAISSEVMNGKKVKKRRAQKKTQNPTDQVKSVTGVEVTVTTQSHSECVVITSDRTYSDTAASSSGKNSDIQIGSAPDFNVLEKPHIEDNKINESECITQSSFDSQPPSQASFDSQPSSQASFDIQPSSQSSVNTQPSTQLSVNSQPDAFLPGSFKIILLVDNQEVSSDRRAINFLEKNGTLVEVRKLSVGDYVWVCQNHLGEELVLPYVIERKRLDDFSKSISDGRFHEQKFRLKRCGLEQCIYLIERYSHHGLPLTTLHQAAVNTQVHDKFIVKFTDGLKDSLNYLSTLTRCIIKLYSKKILVSSDRSVLPKDDCAYLMTYKNFNGNSVKIRNFTISQMFVRHLVQLHGLSVEKASAIVEKYPTPHSLIEAYRNGGDENLLTSISVGKSGRKIGPVISKTLHEMYTSTTLK